MSESISNCNNCNHVVDNSFCSKCGQAVQLKRIDAHYIQHEITHVLHFEKGIFYTIKELIIRPGENVRKFISADRTRLVKPIIFIIITSLIYSILNHYFHINSYIIIGDSKSIAVNAINKWVHNNYGYSNIVEGIFIALWLKLFFKKNGYNFFEILILLCFVMGIGMLIFSVFVLFEGLTKIPVMKASGIVYLIYAMWAIGQFFDGKKIFSYVKVFGAYVLGMVTFTGVILAVGFLVDLLIKH